MLLAFQLDQNAGCRTTGNVRQYSAPPQGEAMCSRLTAEALHTAFFAATH